MSAKNSASESLCVRRPRPPVRTCLHHCGGRQYPAERAFAKISYDKLLSVVILAFVSKASHESSRKLTPPGAWLPGAIDSPGLEGFR